MIKGIDCFAKFCISCARQGLVLGNLGLRKQEAGGLLNLCRFLKRSF